MAFALITALMFTGCDDDIDVAYNLNGIWQGTIEGNYYYDRYGNSEGWGTEIEFVQHGDFASGGYGYEVDYSLADGARLFVEVRLGCAQRAHSHAVR